MKPIRVGSSSYHLCNSLLDIIVKPIRVGTSSYHYCNWVNERCSKYPYGRCRNNIPVMYDISIPFSFPGCTYTMLFCCVFVKQCFLGRSSVGFPQAGCVWSFSWNRERFLRSKYTASSSSKINPISERWDHSTEKTRAATHCNLCFVLSFFCMPSVENIYRMWENHPKLPP